MDWYTFGVKTNQKPENILISNRTKTSKTPYKTSPKNKQKFQNPLKNVTKADFV